MILEAGGQDIDAILVPAENGSAWTLLYPQFSVVVPTPTVFTPLGYSVASSNEALLKALNAWLDEQKSLGTVDALYKHWMLGQISNLETPPRWSVIRDVLGWVN